MAYNKLTWGANLSPLIFGDGIVALINALLGGYLLLNKSSGVAATNTEGYRTKID
jgi:hypothetical protein